MGCRPSKNSTTAEHALQQRYDEGDVGKEDLDHGGGWPTANAIPQGPSPAESRQKQNIWNEVSERWYGRDGEVLEPPLRSGAIALLDALWLVNFVYDNPKAILKCRQELPPDAFLSCDQIIGSTAMSGGIHIIALSYIWLHPQHPDPHGTTLQLEAKWCKEMLQKNIPGSLEITANIPRWGIFWDYASLYQHPDFENGGYRTPEQDRLFCEGLRAMAMLYSHAHTRCFQVTEFPPNYPVGYNLPSGANTASYQERGWPTLEQSLINMGKSSDKTRNLCKDETSTMDKPTSFRHAPLLPKKMVKRFEKVQFTNAKEDHSLVTRLYNDEFQRVFGELRHGSYEQLHWQDPEIVHITEIIRAGYTPNLQILDLSWNECGQTACRALSAALLSPEAPQRIKTLLLCGCLVDKHKNVIQVLAQSLVRKVENLYLCCNGFSRDTFLPFVQAVDECMRNGEEVVLSKIDLTCNDGIRNEDMSELSKVMGGVEVTKMKFGNRRGTPAKK